MNILKLYISIKKIINIRIKIIILFLESNLKIERIQMSTLKKEL